MKSMSASAPEPTTPPRPRRSIREVLDDIAEYQRKAGIPELTEDEAMELAVAETQAVRRELRERGVL